MLSFIPACAAKLRDRRNCCSGEKRFSQSILSRSTSVLQQFVGEACGEVFALGIRNLTALENGHNLVLNDWIAEILLRNSATVPDSFTETRAIRSASGMIVPGNDDAAGEDAACGESRYRGGDLL